MGIDKEHAATMSTLDLSTAITFRGELIEMLIGAKPTNIESETQRRVRIDQILQELEDYFPFYVTSVKNSLKIPREEKS